MAVPAPPLPCFELEPARQSRVPNPLLRSPFAFAAGRFEGSAALQPLEQEVEPEFEGVAETPGTLRKGTLASPPPRP